MSWTSALRNMSAPELIQDIEADQTSTERERIAAHYLREALQEVQDLCDRIEHLESEDGVGT